MFCLFILFFFYFCSLMSVLQVLFFAKARELLKISEAEIILENVDKLEQIYEKLEEKWPKLAQLNRTFALALNEEYLTQENLDLKSGDILAVIPPISGG